jgi:hypothetical protein
MTQRKAARDGCKIAVDARGTSGCDPAGRRSPPPGRWAVSGVLSDLAASPVLTAATVLLLLFAGLSLVDGVYIHLWRLRLHARPESYREHLWHTARAILFAPTVILLFAVPTAGVVLWIGVALVALDEIVELLDVVEERPSRASIGGLSSMEYAVHVMLVTLRVAAVALVLASRPADAWRLDAPVVLGAHPETIAVLVKQLVPGAVLAAGLHVWLAWRHRTAGRWGAAPVST